jgi:hypothetical protein
MAGDIALLVVLLPIAWNRCVAVLMASPPRRGP